MLLIALVLLYSFYGFDWDKCHMSPCKKITCPAGSIYCYFFEESEWYQTSQRTFWEYYTCDEPTSGKYQSYTYVYFANYTPRTPIITPIRSRPPPKLKCPTKHNAKRYINPYYLCVLLLAPVLY